MGRWSPVARAILPVLLFSALGSAKVHAQEGEPQKKSAPVPQSTPDLSSVATPASAVYFSIDSAATFSFRRKDFVFGNEAQHTLVNIRDFKHDLDGLGPGGSATLGYWLSNSIALEMSFSGADQHSKESLRFQQDFTNLEVYFPLIQGSVLGQQALLIGGPLGTPPGTARLNYEQKVFGINGGGRVNLWQGDKNSNLQGIVSFAFLRLEQIFKHRADVIVFVGPLQVPAATRLSTDAEITDDLFGGRFGLAGNYQGLDRLNISGSIFAHIYHRTSDLAAKQNGANMRIPFAGTNRDISVRVRNSDRRFVPRLETQIAASYDLTRNLSIAAFYNFSGLWSMSFPDLPRVHCTIAGCQTDHPLRIGGKDRLFLHLAGLGLMLRF